MLSSNSSSCNHNPNYTPFSEIDITSENPNFLFGLIPNSPYIHLDDYQDAYLHFLDHAYLNTPPDSATPTAVPDENTVGNPNRGTAPSKKDRHSKINTARGTRDRRMRLSLDIARRFFDLQDLLGFDKASRTVDWLLRSSSSAIHALARGRAGSLSEDYWGEAVSSSGAAVGNSRRGRRGKSRGGVVRQKRATVARESRRKARERARERTSQKRRLVSESGVPMYGADVSSDGARSTIQGGVLCPWNSFHFRETDHAAFFHQDKQIEEFEFNGKPWEDYISFNVSA